MVPITAHVAFGHSTGATPDGRKASVTLSDGASAAQGADINGPTAVLMSNHNHTPVSLLLLMNLWLLHNRLHRRNRYQYRLESLVIPQEQLQREEKQA